MSGNACDVDQIKINKKNNKKTNKTNNLESRWKRNPN